MYGLSLTEQHDELRPCSS